MTNQLINQANHFLSHFSLNRYVEKPLYDIDLNEESMIDYLKRENLYIRLNDLNPLVFLELVTYIDILMSVNSCLKEKTIDENYHSENLLEAFLYIEQNEYQQAFINEMTINTGYTFETFADVLNCFTISWSAIPLGDQLPVATFLQAYLCLIDKAKWLKESL